jgi:anti-sigma factor ChrR (cupin superfamily)
MKHDHCPGNSAELAALYAAGALDREERARFEAHLAGGCDACEGELSRLHGVMAALAAAVEPVSPDPATRERLAGRVAAQSNTAGPPPAIVIRKGSEKEWKATAIPGVRARVLAVDRARDRVTALVSMAPGASFPRHVHGAIEDTFVLQGDLCVGGNVLGPGDSQRASAGSSHDEQTTAGGCLVLLLTSLTDFAAEGCRTLPPGPEA